MRYAQYIYAKSKRSNFKIRLFKCVLVPGLMGYILWHEPRPGASVSMQTE